MANRGGQDLGNLIRIRKQRLTPTVAKDILIDDNLKVLDGMDRGYPRNHRERRWNRWRTKQGGLDRRISSSQRHHGHRAAGNYESG